MTTPFFMLLIIIIIIIIIGVGSDGRIPASARGIAYYSVPRGEYRGRPAAARDNASAVVTPGGGGEEAARLPTLSFRLELTAPTVGANKGGRLNVNATSSLVASSLRRKQRLAARASASASEISSSNSSSSSSSSTFDASVISGDGAFLTNLPGTGTPAVAFAALIDTGSDLVWRQCQPCANCFTQSSGDPVFNPSRSSTFRRLPCSANLCSDLPRSSCSSSSSSSSSSSCRYVYAYGDNSYTSGDLVSDTLTLPDLSGRPVSVPNLAFGCGYDNENSNFAGADGIIGLGQGPLSLLSQLSIPRFSYCLQSMGDDPSRSSPLYLGAAASLSGTVQSTPLVSNNPESSGTFYYVTIEGISVGGTAAAIPSDAFYTGVIFDSGTTLTYLDQSVYNRVLDLFRSKIPLIPIQDSGTGLDLCYPGVPSNVPSLTFRFGGGAHMLLPIANYFIAVDDNLVCLALAASNDISIIGNIQQQNFHILYDLQEQRLSFAPAACDSL